MRIKHLLAALAVVSVWAPAVLAQTGCPTSGSGVTCFSGKYFCAASASCVVPATSCPQNQVLSCGTCGCTCPGGTTVCGNSASGNYQRCIANRSCPNGMTWDVCSDTCVTPYVLLAPGAVQSGTPSLNGSLSLTGTLNLGGDIFMPNSKAIQVNASGATALNLGNWTTPGSFLLNVIGDVSASKTSMSNLCLGGTCRTTWPGSSDFADTFVDTTGDTMTGLLRFGTAGPDAGGGTGLVGNPNGWTRIDPNGQRFLIPVSAAQVAIGANIVDIEDPSWGHRMELRADGGAYFGGSVGVGTGPVDRLSVAGGGGNINLGGNFPGYNGIWLNGGTAMGNYSILSSFGDPDLYINRPTGRNLRFRENNADQMVIAAGGKVGIGTATPTQKLTVFDAANNGGFNFNAYNQVISTTFGTGGSVQLGVSDAGSGNMAGASLYLGGSTRGDGNKNAARFMVGTTEVMRVDGDYAGHTAGNVGIGTTAPTNGRLEVQGSGSTAGVYAVGANYGVYGLGSYGLYGASNGGWNTGVYGTGSSIGVRAESAGTALYAISSGTSGGGVYGNNTATTGSTYGVEGVANSAGGYGVYALNTNAGGYGVYSGGGQNTFIGNVGINNTAPGYKLTIDSLDDFIVKINKTTAWSGGGYSHGIAQYAPNMGIGAHFAGLELGQSPSPKNDGYMAFVYNGPGSNSNYLSLGLFAVDDALTVSGAGGVGIGGMNASYKLYVNGNAYSTGGWSGSDARWKKEVKTVTGALAKVERLRGVTFDWRTKEFPNKGFDDRTHLGFIAQEVEPVVPELVSTDADGYKSVAYENVTALLAEAVKELDGKLTATVAIDASGKATVKDLAVTGDLSVPGNKWGGAERRRACTPGADCLCDDGWYMVGVTADAARTIICRQL